VLDKLFPDVGPKCDFGLFVLDRPIAVGHSVTFQLAFAPKWVRVKVEVWS